MKVVLDTNIIIEHLDHGTLAHVGDEIKFLVSVITEAELFRLSGVSESEVKSIENFLAITELISVDSAIARRAALLGRTRKTKLPDLLIAATALEYGVPLVTKNKEDFGRIPSLKMVSKV